MTFIRTKNINGNEYAYLCKTFREDGKVRQKVIKYLGRADQVLSEEERKHLGVFSEGQIEKHSAEELHEMRSEQGQAVDEAKKAEKVDKVEWGKHTSSKDYEEVDSFEARRDTGRIDREKYEEYFLNQAEEHRYVAAKFDGGC